MGALFAQPHHHAQGWYVALRSQALRRGQARTVAMLGRRVVLYRGTDGTARALDARCPHLGADLGQGRVDGDAIVCAFHGWRVAADGSCGGGERRARAYPVQERWGIVWLFNGPTPLFDLPALEGRMLRLPPQTIACHPHLVLANGLDAGHLGALHDMHLRRPPEVEDRGRFSLAVHVVVRPGSAWMRALTATTDRDLEARFATHGPGLAVASFAEPTRFDVLFTARSGANAGHCLTQTLIFVPRWQPLALVRALLTTYALVAADRRALEGLEFRNEYCDSDAPLRTWAARVDAMPTW